MFQAVIEVKVDGEQRMSGSVCPGGSDIDKRPDDISRNVVVRDASAASVCDISRYVVIRGAPHIIGGGLVGASPLMSSGGSFVVDGGFEPP